MRLPMWGIGGWMLADQQPAILPASGREREGVLCGPASHSTVGHPGGGDHGQHFLVANGIPD
jgi:hypothetical protein